MRHCKCSSRKASDFKSGVVYRVLSVFRRLVPDPAVVIHGHGLVLPLGLRCGRHLPHYHDLRLGDALLREEGLKAP